MYRIEKVQLHVCVCTEFGSSYFPHGFSSSFSFPFSSSFSFPVRHAHLSPP